VRRTLLAIIGLLIISLPSARADEPAVSVSGYILTDFVQYVNTEGRYTIENQAGDWQLKANKGYDAFEITRAYLTFSANLSEKVFASLTTDLYTNDDGYRTIFAKYAFVELRELYPHGKLRLGLQEPPWSISDSELWKYRIVEQGFYSYWGTFSSADYGVSLLGDFFDGLVKYHLAVLNGEGYSKIENASFKQYVGRITLDFGSADKFRFYPSIGYSSNHREHADLKDNVLMAGAGLDVGGRFHLAGEYFQGIYTMEEGDFPLVRGRWPEGAVDAIAAASGDSALLTEDKDIDFMGWAIYGELKLWDKLNLFGRYDLYEPNRDSDYDRDGELMWMAGICYHPIDNLWMTIDYRENSFQQPDPDDDGEQELPPSRMIYTHWKIAF